MQRRKDQLNKDKNKKTTQLSFLYAILFEETLSRYSRESNVKGQDSPYILVHRHNYK